MKLVEESKLRELLLSPERMKDAIKILFRKQYLLYGESEEKYYRSLDRNSRDELGWFWRCATLIYRCRTC